MVRVLLLSDVIHRKTPPDASLEIIMEDGEEEVIAGDAVPFANQFWYTLS
jgi:hypothetical protein